MKRLILSVGLAGLAAVGFGFSYTADFESPKFTANSGLGGQDGWSAGTAYTVQSTAAARSGSQVAQWSNAGGATGIWAGVSLPVAPIVSASVWLNISPNSNPSYFFGLDPFYPEAQYSRIVVNGAGEVRGTTVAGSSMTSVLGNVGNIANQWVQLTVSINLDTNKVSATVKGATFNLPDVPVATSLAEISLYTLPVSPPAGTSGFAWYDDYTVEAVPEPATLAVLAAGALALRRRRRV